MFAINMKPAEKLHNYSVMENMFSNLSDNVIIEICYYSVQSSESA